jgi:Chemotaxis protein; stimulates methylation of MCP proteins
MAIQPTNPSADAASTEQVSRQHVNIGDYAVTDAGCELVTYGLGSCLGVALFDATAGVAGLAHVKRANPSGQQANDDAVFVDAEIRALYSEMQSQGVTRQHTVAKLVGGIDTGNNTSLICTGIGERNIKQADATLAALDITVAERDVGGDAVRTVFFDGETGALTIETGCGDRYTI